MRERGRPHAPPASDHTMKLSMHIARGSGPDDTARWAVEMETAGIDTLWIGEAYGFDAVSMLGYLAGRTTRVGLGAAILPVFSRSPALVAMTAAGLDFVSSGRFILGLGASGPQVVTDWHGVPYDRPLARTPRPSTCAGRCGRDRGSSTKGRRSRFRSGEAATR